MTFSVAVAGASGYAGGELLRILSGHAEFEVRTVTAHTNAGAALAELHPHLRSLAHLTLAETTPATLAGHDVVFLALPHGASGAITAQLPNDVLVIDCGADHRLDKPADWAAYYGGEYYGAWTYGMPELLVSPISTSSITTSKQRDALATATRIAAPGCNASAVTLALAPAVASGLVEPTDLSAVLAVGPSGAGKSLRVDLLGAELMGSANPYAVGGVHRHTPEIVQNLRKGMGLDTSAGADYSTGAKSLIEPVEIGGLSTSSTGGQSLIEPVEISEVSTSSTDGGSTGESSTDAAVTISMTPVLVPMARGILATCSATLKPGVTLADVRAAYEAAYGDEQFVQLLPQGSFPRTADTLGANTCLIGLTIDPNVGRLVVVSALDNLVKGTAGAAVQCANIALGLPEGMGLSVDGVAP